MDPNQAETEGPRVSGVHRTRPRSSSRPSGQQLDGIPFQRRQSPVPGPASGTDEVTSAGRDPQHPDTRLFGSEMMRCWEHKGIYCLPVNRKKVIPIIFFELTKFQHCRDRSAISNGLWMFWEFGFSIFGKPGPTCVPKKLVWIQIYILGKNLCLVSPCESFPPWWENTCVFLALEVAGFLQRHSAVYMVLIENTSKEQWTRSLTICNT